MAACSGIEHIFEKKSETPTFLESLSPCNHFKSSIDDDDSSSFTEIFGELHFREKNAHSSSSSLSSITAGEFSSVDQEREKRSSERKQYGRRHNESLSSDSLSLCTEGLGFESCDEVEEMLSHDLCNNINKEWPQHQGGDRDGERNNVGRNSSSSSHYWENHRNEAAAARGSTRGGAFPPPISCIGTSGKPWVCFKSYREEGRFILKEIRIPTQELLHACRQDGRLKLQFVQSDDDELLQEEEDDENVEQQNQEEEEEEAEEEEEEEEDCKLQNSSLSM